MATSRQLTYLVAVSLDGFIAAPDGDFSAFPVEGDHIDWLIDELPETLPAPALAALGIEPAYRTFDTVVMGWNTFAAGLPAGVDDPYPGLHQVVCSTSHGPDEVGGDVVVTDRDPVEVVRDLKARPGGGIWLCGGGRLAASLAGEIDRLVLKVNPLVLGSGIGLFGTTPVAAGPFALQRSRPFASGVVVNTYERVA